MSAASPLKMLAQARLERVQDALAAAGLDALLLFDTPSIEWLTTFRNVFDDEQAHAAFIVVGQRQVWIHTDSRYVTAMEREAKGMPFAISAKQESASAWARRLWDQLMGAEAEPVEPWRCGIEDTLRISQYQALKEAFAPEDPFTVTSGFMLGLRAVKDDHEIRCMQAAQALTDAAFDHILGFMTPGMTERDVQLELDGFMLRNGADSLAFQTIVASGANGASPHALVSQRALQQGDCVVMDFGARWAGYCSDMTRTVFLGMPDRQMRSAWEALRRANETVEGMLGQGITGKEAHDLALRVLDEAGFGGLMGHGLGHGVGIEVHEQPVLSPRNTMPLEAGNVVTVEPGIYLPGQFGMRLEDFGVVREDAFEVFTASSHDLLVI